VQIKYSIKVIFTFLHSLATSKIASLITEEPMMAKLSSHQLLEQVMYCFCCRPCCFTVDAANPASAAAAVTPVDKTAGQ
jgi:hypothetical protein